ncbi:acyl-CoA synthetase [Aldersonia sp. NBC_00410]|uniref:acyl-CoA synthetase n=1 Tax=Aldersonia sp. NBC_00410 TaxID=2975954 RepID=UPI0022506681|nr:acyl-CoA synthetase [Aldersonia sp. NBC_00410]MCX5045362.1 acyl-CoA synthetase [Aldersonia sp. NBC_00410]
MTEWTLGDILDAVAGAVPDRTMTVCGDRKRTFAEIASDTRRFANFLADRGFGMHTRREDLANWECGQDRIALIMRNDRYPEVLLGCLKARAIPVNVNHHYTAGEVRDLLDYVGPRGVVYHRSLGPVVAEALDGLDLDLVVVADDGSEEPDIDGAVSLDDAIALGDPDRVIPTSPDDLLMMCTGGTTGRPKGVLWRQSDMYVAAMAGSDHASAEVLRDIARGGGQVWFAVSPLLHAAGVWTALAGVLTGQTVVLYDDRHKFDARTVLETAEREKVFLMTMVGDAFAGPLVGELQANSYDLSGLFVIGTGGAATNPVHKRALLEAIPHATIIDGYGSSETGGMGFGNSRRGSSAETFVPRPGGTVVSADRTRVLAPGDTEIGWAARSSRIPLGYYNDPDATERTFPVIDGVRFAIPGDRATVENDGAIRVLGRDSLVVNTGGEKVFVEEVEDVLRAHPMVADALVVGRASERWGQEVVALVARRSTNGVDEAALLELCKSRLAGFKVPKAVLFVGQIRRLGNGKPDYRWAADRVVVDGDDPDLPTGDGSVRQLSREVGV